MVALNTLSSESKRSHLETIKKEAEKLVISSALQAGVDPININPATHPLPDSFNEEDEGFDQLAVNLAERVKAYNVIQNEINLL